MGWFDNFVPVTGWPGGVVTPVDPAEPIPGGAVSPSSVSMTAGQPFSQQFTASGGTGPHVWSVSGTLPGDLVLAGDTIAGSDPGVTGTAYFFVLRATDSTGDYIDQLISGTVQSPVILPNIADVFSTDLYTGNGTSQSVTNGIDLNGDGGMVWTKVRTNSGNHQLFDTARGAGFAFSTNSGGPSNSYPTALTAFNSDGFSLGADTRVNLNGQGYVAWSLRKAPGFFDVVQYTGNGSVQAVPHSLGVPPGMILVKRADGAANNWAVYHKGADDVVPHEFSNIFNSTIPFVDSSTFADTAPTSTHFTVGASSTVNTSPGTYLAYLFADTDIIRCGSYIGDGTAPGPDIPVGFEPQFLLIKAAGANGEWAIVDAVRNPTDPRNSEILANRTNAESTSLSSTPQAYFLPNGFRLHNNPVNYNSNGTRYVYVAIAAE